MEDGGRYYETFASCVRVYRLQAALRLVGDGTGCAVAGEECCVVSADELFVHVWPLDLPSANTSAGPVDSTLTSDPAELAALKKAVWAPVCVATVYGRGPTDVCVAPALPFSYGPVGVFDASRAPFVLYAFANATSNGAAVPLVRCVDPASGRHLMTNSTGGCAAAAPGFAFDRLLGYGLATHTGLFSRAVRRCAVVRGGSASSNSEVPSFFYTAVNNLCVEGDQDDGLLLYAS